METKHTPGPWYHEFIEENEHGVKVYSINQSDDADFEYGKDAHVTNIAHVYETEDNAQLIAAAPETAKERDELKTLNAELLNALTKIMNHIDEQRLVRNIQDDDKPDFAIRQLPLVMDLKQAVELINKAKGQ